MRGTVRRFSDLTLSCVASRNRIASAERGHSRFVRNQRQKVESGDCKAPRRCATVNAVVLKRKGRMNGKSEQMTSVVPDVTPVAGSSRREIAGLQRWVSGRRRATGTSFSAFAGTNGGDRGRRCADRSPACVVCDGVGCEFCPDVDFVIRGAGEDAGAPARRTTLLRVCVLSDATEPMSCTSFVCLPSRSRRLKSPPGGQGSPRA